MSETLPTRARVPRREEVMDWTRPTGVGELFDRYAVAPLASGWRWWRERRRRKQMDSETQRIIEATREDIQEIVAMIQTVQAGGRSWFEIAPQLFHRVVAILEAAGQVWQSLSDREERPKRIKEIILGALQAASIDLPGPDELEVDLIVRAATHYWRYLRGREPDESLAIG